MKNGCDTLSEAIAALQNRGYTVNFDLVEYGLLSKDLKKQWKAGEIEVVKLYRFEGMSSAGGNTILYVLECKTGERGLLKNAYGADQYISSTMIQKLKMQ
jgi:hypothetical protein